MAKKTLAQLVERLLAAATDLLHIGSSGKDYKIQLSTLSKYMWKYLDQDYFIVQAEKNIASADGINDLSIYEDNGASAKPDGFIIEVSWLGGDGSNKNLFTGTQYTINGQPIADFEGWGAGKLLLKKDGVNSNWIVLNDQGSVFDLYTPSALITVERYVNKRMRIYATVSGTANTYTAVTFPKAFLPGTTPKVWATSNYAEGSNIVTPCGTISATACRIGTIVGHTGSYFNGVAIFVYIADGFYV